jgi:Omp85 superfamily domain
MKTMDRLRTFKPPAGELWMKSGVFCTGVRLRDMLRRVALVALVVMSGVSAHAQSRADEMAKQQEEKAARAQPYEQKTTEMFLDQVEHGKWILLAPPRGWYVTFGSVYQGGGFTPGGGYRHYIGYDSYVDAGGLYSIEGYKQVHVTGFTPNHLNSHVDLEGSIVWLDATHISFYGLGNDSGSEERANFRLNRGYVEGAAVLRPVKWLRLRVDGGLDDYSQKPGKGSSPSIEEVFTPETAPLLGEDPVYLRGEISATAYWLASPGYSRTGGLYRVAYEEFNPLHGEGDTFGFLRAEVVQHVPMLRETWVLSLRGGAESIVRESDVVPYFLMPTLGGGSDLRGYATHRFRDRHSLILSSEARWFPNRLGLDTALFADAGKVASSRTGLTLHDLKFDYGIGVRFHTLTITALRIDLARSNEGLRLVFAGSAAF